MSSRKLLLLFAVVCLFGLRPATAQLGVYATASGQRFGGITCPTFVSSCGNNSGHVTPYGGNFGAYYDFRNFGPIRLGGDLRGDVLASNKRADSSSGGAGVFRQYAVLGGVRGSVRTPFSWLKPYAEVAAGFARNNASGVYTTTTTTTNTTSTTTTSTGTTTATSTGTVTGTTFNPNLYTVYPVFKGFVGLDIKILPYLDIRAIEFGGGAAFGSTVTGVATNVTVNQTITNGTISSSTSSSTSVNQTSSSSSHSMESISAGIVFHLP